MSGGAAFLETLQAAIIIQRFTTCTLKKRLILQKYKNMRFLCDTKYRN